MSDSYPSIRRAFNSTVWAIHPPKLAEIRELIAARARGEKVPEDRVRAVAGERRAAGGVQMLGRTAVLSVFGTIMMRVGAMERSSGGVSSEEIGYALQGLVNDKSVENILMMFDSGGGDVAGTPELADKMRSLGGRKRISGAITPFCASAAYWLASQCDDLAINPSGQVGSIGVLAAHEDESEALRQEGVKTTYIVAEDSPYKVDGASEYPLTETARQDFQGKVDQYMGMFVGAVARGRGVSTSHVKSRMGGGRMLTAKDALAANMVDRIETLQDTIARVGKAGGKPGAASARRAAEHLRAEAREARTGRGPADGRNAAAAMLLELDLLEIEDGTPARDRPRASPSYDGLSPTALRARLDREAREEGRASPRRAAPPPSSFDGMTPAEVRRQLDREARGY